MARPTIDYSTLLRPNLPPLWLQRPRRSLSLRSPPMSYGRCRPVRRAK